MKRTLAFALLLAVSGCAPTLVVKREERPRFEFPPQVQPLSVSQPSTGSVVLDVLTSFNESQWRVRRAVERVSQLLLDARLTVTGAPETARTHLTVGVSENGISDADKNGVRTAKIELWIQSELADTHLNGSATAKDTDGNLYLSAIENALQQFSAGLYATEVSDTFIVRDGEGLTDANNKLLDGDFPGAIAAYNERLAQVPNDVKALCNLSAALTAMGDLQGALDVATRAIDADVPNYRFNRKADAQAAADRLARTTKMLGNTTYGSPKK